MGTGARLDCDGHASHPSTAPPPPLRGGCSGQEAALGSPAGLRCPQVCGLFRGRAEQRCRLRRCCLTTRSPFAPDVGPPLPACLPSCVTETSGRGRGQGSSLVSPAGQRAFRAAHVPALGAARRQESRRAAAALPACPSDPLIPGANRPRSDDRPHHGGNDMPTLLTPAPARGPHLPLHHCLAGTSRSLRLIASLLPRALQDPV